jgi:hypothetical protein
VQWKEQPLRRYFFVIEWPDRKHEDLFGTLFSSDRDARDYAARVIRELKEAGEYDDPGLIMVVENAKREPIFTIPF